MVRKIVLMLLLSTAVALIGIPGVSGLSNYLNAFNAKYNTEGTELDTCNICHAGVPNLNQYGQSVAGQSGNISQRLTNVENMDSDGDGFINIDEINNQTFPGNASDFPPVPAPPPQPTAFNISGFKINDTNGNGIWNSGEVGIDNWSIKLSNATTGTEIANTSTDSSGFYKFNNLTNGSYNVTEEMKPGFTPTNVTFMIVTIAGQDITNLNFTNNVSVLPPPPLPTAAFNISGFKINDTNGNGIWDQGEIGIDNWSIKLYNATTGTEIANTTTNGNGSYSFINLTNGTYNVTEEMKPGWANTSAISQVITINGSDAVNVDFKNQLVPLPPPQPAAFNISGFKINDTNGNGIWDQGETGIDDWDIKLLNTTTGTEIANTTTNGNGFYQFANLTNGSYNVTEGTKPGFTPTNDTSMLVTVAGQDIMNLNFTNNVSVLPPLPPVTFSISGFKINDTNGNGIWNSGEMGIGNWSIKLSNATTGTEIADTSTDSSGFYQFTNLTNGSYNVTEEMKPGWTGTNDTSMLVTVAGQDVMNLNFTNNITPIPPPVAAFNISGFKINDTNGNGVWDSGEMGIENWNIKLSNATTGTEIANTSTDASGFYKFENLVPGDYNVTEETKEGFTPTNATSSVMTVENTDITNLNFTNQPVAPPTAVITSFELTPEKTTELKKTPINITIKALNNGALQTFFNGTANIIITAKDVSAVTFPQVANFTGGIAVIEVNSDIAQHVTVTASSNGVNGSTKIMFADKIFNLIKGWNLISIPNFADPSSINETLQFVQNNGVVGYDPATNLFSTPTDLLPLFGYWINVTADNQTLGFIASTNITSVPPSRTLYEGWNLIGVSANKTDPDNLKAGELFAELKYGPDPTQWLYTRLVSYEQPLSPVTLVSGTGLSDSTELKQGSGYWLFIKNVPSTDQNNVPWAGKQW